MTDAPKQRAMTVSFRGDPADVAAVNEIARRDDKKTADYIRSLVERDCKERNIDFDALRSFFAVDGQDIDHLVKETA